MLSSNFAKSVIANSFGSDFIKKYFGIVDLFNASDVDLFNASDAIDENNNKVNRLYDGI